MTIFQNWDYEKDELVNIGSSNKSSDESSSSRSEEEKSFYLVTSKLDLSKEE